MSTFIGIITLLIGIYFSVEAIFHNFKYRRYSIKNKFKHRRITGYIGAGLVIFGILLIL